jgi:hypothetical protein
MLELSFKFPIKRSVEFHTLYKISMAKLNLQIFNNYHVFIA